MPITHRGYGMTWRVAVGAITVLWSAIAAMPVRAQPPGYDIESLCGEVARYGAGMPSLGLLRGCAAQERASRDQLARIWDQVPAAVRTRCAEVARLVGTGSYVMLNACVTAQSDAKPQARH